MHTETRGEALKQNGVSAHLQARRGGSSFGSQASKQASLAAKIARPNECSSMSNLGVARNELRSLSECSAAVKSRMGYDR